MMRIVTIALIIGTLFTRCDFDEPTDASIFGNNTRKLVLVEGGTCTINKTTITISGFNVDNFEITYELWTEVRNWGLTHGYTDLPTGQGGSNSSAPNNPVTHINWYDAVKWCNAHSEKDSLFALYFTNGTQNVVYRTGAIDIGIDAVNWAGNGYRLPTECEWEYAARGGNQTHGYSFSGSNTYDDVAWCGYNSSGKTHPVGYKGPNELGIYDMSGNASEWCWDWYISVYPSGGTTDPKGPSSKTYLRILRGGSYSYVDQNCTVGRGSLRNIDPGFRGDDTGFRIVKTIQ